MDQTESALEELSRHLDERRQDSAQDRPLYVFNAFVSEVPVKARNFATAYVANITSQFVQEV